MKTESLPVKYRPRRFADFIGQDRIVAELSGAFKRGSLNSSYMITGPSGLGKTTLARLLARSINCEAFDVERMRPCGKCRSCKMESHPDLSEFNFAAQRGIDDVRAIIQQCRNRPILGRKKIFLLDEIHQATPQAQEAFLKPLEEPPEDTVWIVCTTNPEKVKDTFRNRCTPLTLRFVEPEVVAKRLTAIAAKEGHDMSDKVGQAIVMSIAENCNGQPRNGITMLSSVLNVLASGQKVKNADSFIQRFMQSEEGDIEEASAHLLSAYLLGDADGVVKAIRSVEQPRALVSKTRWLIEHLLESKLGRPRFTPASARVFSASKTKTTTAGLCGAQYVLCRAEAAMNSLNIDERVILQSFMVNGSSEK